MSAPLRIGRRRLAGGTILALALALVACSAGAGSAPGGVTACTARETRTALVSFVAAFDRGDYRRLDALFARPVWFRWYSSSAPGERLRAAAQRRSTLIAYFRARHAQGDRLRLLSFRFNGNWGGYGNFVWKMRRAADDFRGGAWFTTEAKGAAVCEGGRARFIVMSLGGPEP